MNTTNHHKGPFPLHITQNDEHFVIVTNQGNHYAKTFDPSASRLICAAPDLLDALRFLLADYIAIEGEKLTGSRVPLEMAQAAISKAEGNK
jgi:hypothetical protein